MTTAGSPRRPVVRACQRWHALVVLTFAATTFTPAISRSQDTEPAKPVRVAAGESGDQWLDLLPAQRQFLQPLEHDWGRLDPQQRRKWRVLSNRAPKMSADERQRIQARMTEWATLTPEQRSQARLRYQAAKQLPAQDRQARWDSYQSLPPEQKQQLADRAALAPDHARKPAPAGGRGGERPGHEPQPVAKSNIIPNPALAAPPKPIGAALLQARPGATTTLISKPATPPAHQQTGMPKIAATPEFVNRATLQPRRGPQAAADAGSAARPTARDVATPASSAETVPRP